MVDVLRSPTALSREQLTTPTMRSEVRELWSLPHPSAKIKPGREAKDTTSPGNSEPPSTRLEGRRSGKRSQGPPSPRARQDSRSPPTQTPPPNGWGRGSGSPSVPLFLQLLPNDPPRISRKLPVSFNPTSQVTPKSRLSLRASGRHRSHRHVSS